MNVVAGAKTRPVSARLRNRVLFVQLLDGRLQSNRLLVSSRLHLVGKLEVLSQVRARSCLGAVTLDNHRVASALRQQVVGMGQVRSHATAYLVSRGYL